METVPEGSTAWLTIRLFGKDGASATPATLTYRIDDAATLMPVRENTEVESPAAITEIELTPEDNAILNERGLNERRLVTVQATFSNGRAHNQQYVYRVENLGRVQAGNELG
ncbi:MAG: hypothetical protein DCC55_11370 [Chloroflexi bacterium]|nr:MAG: hypothetical protein DCC55_11370 [Chloroflexota bacterium]